MSSDTLNPFSYAILALVGEGGAGPHDLVRMMRTGRKPYWATSESHFYAEPKRLAKLGYLTAVTGPGRTRQRTHYRLTDRGREALRAWAREPTPFPRIQSEAVVRLLAGDIVADDATLAASLSALRRELDEIESGLDEAEATAETLPHRERYLRLVHRLGRGLVQTHRDWLDEVERELTSPADSEGVRVQRDL
jgi:DNA-binding PadR family transcriptional regulator